MEEENICGILAPIHLNGHIDNDGCIKKCGHNDNHIFKDQNGKLISWEDDYSCGCGCWDDYEKGDNESCIVYYEVKNLEDENRNKSRGNKG